MSGSTFIVKAFRPGQPEVAVTFWASKQDAEEERDRRNLKAAARGATVRYVVRETSPINGHIESSHRTPAPWCPLCRRREQA